MPEKAPDSRDTNPNSVTEQVPHSGIHGNERPVYNFDGKDLQEALDRGDLHIEYDENGKPKVIVPDTIGDHIDPTQSQRTEVYEPLASPIEEVEERTPVWKRWVAGVIGGSVLVGGGYAVSQLGDGSTEPRVNPGISDTPNPGDQTGSPEKPAEPVTLEGLNKPPTAEQLKLAETPVSSTEYPTIEEAYAALHDRINVYAIGATMDFDATPVAETPESLESKEKLLDVIYGPGHESRPNFSVETADAVRERVGLKFYYFYEIAKKEMTFSRNSEVTSIEPTTVPGTSKAYIVHNIGSVESNMSEINPSETDFDVIIANPQTQEATVVLAEDGNWYIHGVSHVE